jgi:hypothetical protein
MLGVLMRGGVEIAVIAKNGLAYLIFSILVAWLTGIQLVADIISATSPHHFLVFCHIFASCWRKIKVDNVLESEESRASS